MTPTQLTDSLTSMTLSMPGTMARVHSGCQGVRLGYKGLQVRLNNDRVIVRHVDQLRHHARSHETNSSKNSPDTGGTPERGDTESVETDSSEMVEIPESSTELTVQEPDIETPHTEEPVGDPPVETDLSGHSQEPEASEPLDDGSTPPTVRRSSRTRQPRARYEDTVMFT